MPRRSDRIRDFPMQSGQEPTREPTGGSFMIDLASDLTLVLGFTVITLGFIFVPYINETIIRSALGLVLVLFLPGYTFIAVLFPGKADISDFERGVLSFGLSVALVPLIGFALNYTPWGIRLVPITICLGAFTVVCSLVANARRLLAPAARALLNRFRTLLQRSKKGDISNR